MPTKLEKFLDEPLTGKLIDVPGIGEKMLATLKEKNVKTSYQLLGTFLKLDRNEDEITDLLLLCVPEGERAKMKQHIDKSASALKERVEVKGVEVNFRLSNHVIKTATSQFNDAKKTEFIQKKLTGKLSDDFFGIGPDSEAKFTKEGIKTTDELFGEFLKGLGPVGDEDFDPSMDTKWCDAFYDRLTSLGAASGYKSAIIYQIQAKLAVGIDSHGAEALKLKDKLPKMPTVPEDALNEEAFDKMSLDAPGTVGKSRVGRAAPED